MQPEDFLLSLGASESEVNELLKYNENVFHLSAITGTSAYPLPDEPFVSAWEQYAVEALKRGVLLVVTVLTGSCVLLD